MNREATPHLPGPSIRRLAWLGALLCLSAGLLPARSAENATPGEYQLKAVFLYNFAKFIEWPASRDTNAPIVIGVLGDDPFGAVLDETLNKARPILGRPVVAKRVKSDADMKACHILFISSSEKGRLKEIFATLKGADVLTVAEMDQFCQTGGMIRFTRNGDAVATEINLDTGERAGLKFSSKLLRLSVVVGAARTIGAK